MEQEETCQPFEGFNYYDINEFDFVSNINKSKSFIYLYRHRSTKQFMAVKQLKTQSLNLTKAEMEMKIRILKYLHDLKHPNVVEYKGVSRLCKRIGDRYLESVLIFMEHCERDLHDYTSERYHRKEFFTIDEIKDFIEQMLTPLELLERWGIAHRDIKPQNILVQRNKYKLCDFEDAVLCGGESAYAPLNITTPGYSPFSMVSELKHRRQKAYDPFKADVYSLGITLLAFISLGNFTPNQRICYCDNARDHSLFMKQMRKKYVKRYESGNLNRVIKLMLEDDEYKRENFRTLKIKLAQLSNIHIFDENRSQNSSTTEDTSKKSVVALKLKDTKEAGRTKAVVQGLGMGLFILFILLCLL